MKGFTLIEMAIVIFIFGLLSVGGLRVLETMVSNHQVSLMRANVDVIRTGIAWNSVKDRTCEAPSCNATQYTYTLPANLDGFPRDILTDPWGQPTKYTPITVQIDQATPFGSAAFTVTSSGPDTQFGTVDDFVTSVSVGELKSIFIRLP